MAEGGALSVSVRNTDIDKIARRFPDLNLGDARRTITQPYERHSVSRTYYVVDAAVIQMYSVGNNVPGIVGANEKTTLGIQNRTLAKAGN